MYWRLMLLGKHTGDDANVMMQELRLLAQWVYFSWVGDVMWEANAVFWLESMRQYVNITSILKSTGVYGVNHLSCIQNLTFF